MQQRRRLRPLLEEFDSLSAHVQVRRRLGGLKRSSQELHACLDEVRCRHAAQR